MITHLLLICTLVSIAFAEIATNHCIATGMLPNKHFHLRFCGESYPHQRCCSSSTDTQNRESYVALTSTDAATCGPSSPASHKAMKEIRDFLCLPCDPHEPSYRYKQFDGDLHLGGQAPPNPDADPEEWAWRICKTFIFGKDGKSGMWGADGSKFNECGYSAAQCKNAAYLEYDENSSTWIRNFPETCTFPADSGPVFPSLFYSGTELQKAAQVLQDAWSAVNNFAFYVVDDQHPSYSYDEAPCFGRNYSPLNGHSLSIHLLVIATLGLFL